MYFVFGNNPECMDDGVHYNCINDHIIWKFFVQHND